MSEISVQAYKPLSMPVPVPVDEEGRPQCFCGCAESMVEVEPGVWQCALSRRALDLVATKLGPMMERLLTP